MDVPLWIIVVAMLLALLGAVVQGVIGFGLGVVVTPLLALLRPELVPVASIMAAVALPIGSLVDEWRHFDWSAFGWIILTRVPGTLLGAWLVAQLPPVAFQVTVAVVVLLMVALTAVDIRVPRNRFSLGAAGLISGITGTSTGIGGPPLAIVLINEEPARARATMAGLFLVGTGLSLATLAANGAVHGNALLVGGLMAPVTLLGLLVARRLRGRVGWRGFRRGVYLVSTVSALVLLVQALI